MNRYLLVCFLGACLSLEAQTSQSPQPIQPQRAETLKASHSPFTPTPLVEVHKAVKAQYGPGTPSLAKAWSLYKKLQGSWMPKHPKPSQADIASLDALKAELEKLPLPSWFIELQKNAGKAVNVAPVFDTKSVEFSKFKQTEETERIKALGLIYMAEHDIDRPNTAQKAAVTLSTLMSRTFFDFDLHALYARFLIDAQVPKVALYEARMSIYLNPAPTLDDLRFASFIWFVAARDQWGELEAIIRETASTPSGAEIVIKEMNSKFKDQKNKTVFTPGKG